MENSGDHAESSFDPRTAQEWGPDPVDFPHADGVLICASFSSCCIKICGVTPSRALGSPRFPDPFLGTSFRSLCPRGPYPYPQRSTGPLSLQVTGLTNRGPSHHYFHVLEPRSSLFAFLIIWAFKSRNTPDDPRRPSGL